MDGEQLLQLEKAAVDVMSPPYAVTEEARRKAEAVFLELRKAKQPYDTCKYILEQSHTEYVLFQAGSTIREAVLREWPVLPAAEKDALRHYLLHYLTSHPGLAGYVREQLVHTVALMVKRSTLEVNQTELFDSVFATVSRLLGMDAKLRQLGCSLLSAILTEYSSSSGSSSIGLPLEFHLQCKKAIQDRELLRVLHLAVQVLQQYLTADWSSLSPADTSLLAGFLSLTSHILNWDFKCGHFRPVLLANPHTSSFPLRPPKSYAPTFLDPSFLNLFFKLLGKLRTSEEHVHHVVQCLTQLASLTKPVFTTDEEQQGYVGTFIAGLLGYVYNSDYLNQQEMYGLSCILRRLTVTFPAHHFAPIGPIQLKMLVSSLSQLTCLCAQRAVQAEESQEDSLMYQESLEHFLEVWVCLLEGAVALPPALLTKPSIDVFHAYVQSKLSSPRGWRTGQTNEDEIIDLVEDDRTAFKDQLSGIGYIARRIASHSLPLLLSNLAQCTAECLRVLSAVQSSPQALYSGQNNLDALHEDLHWLVLITCFTLCDIVDGEDILVPARLMRFSIENQESVQTAELPLSALIWREDGGEQVDLRTVQLDPIVALVLSVCRLCVVEKLFVSQGLLDVLSPQVCETNVWCLSKIVEPYLMLSEDSYEQLSMPLLAAFGRDTESARWLTAFLLEKVTFNLSVWSAEESLALTSVHLLRSIVKSATRAAAAIQCDSLWSLMRGFSSGHAPLDSLPPAVQREFMSGLLVCCVGERREQFLTELLQPFHQRFLSLVHLPEFQSRSPDGTVLHTLLSILEALCGLALGSRPDSIQILFSFLLPLLQTSVSILELYADSPETVRVILELFSLVAENYIVFLNEACTMQLYEVSLALIRVYAKNHTGKYTKLALTEEEQCEDLLLFMKMLTHLTTKDYLDFGGGSSRQGVEPVDVVITGISIILPLMTEEILKFPSLCQQFYTLVDYVCQLFPEKVVTMPEKLFLTTISLLEAGITSYGPDICKSTLECIDSIATHSARNSHLLPPCPHLTQSLQHFMKLVFELMLGSAFDMDLLGPAAAATFSLICAQKDYYTTLAGLLVSSQSEAQNHSRLVDAFSKLTPHSLALDLTRASRLRFRTNLEEFLPFVKGFLCYR